MFRWFEKRVEPFPGEEPPVPPRSFFPFVWDMSRGVRGYILGIGFLAALVGVAIAFVLQAVMYGNEGAKRNKQGEQECEYNRNGSPFDQCGKKYPDCPE